MIVINSSNNYQNQMVEKLKRIKDKNHKNNDAIMKCQIFYEEKKEKNLNKLIEKMIHKSDILESF